MNANAICLAIFLIMFSLWLIITGVYCFIKVLQYFKPDPQTVKPATQWKPISDLAKDQGRRQNSRDDSAKLAGMALAALILLIGFMKFFL